MSSQRNKPFIGQPDRMSLKAAIAESREFLHGRVLDVGAGLSNRYGHFVSGELVRMDIVQRDGIALVGRADAIPASDASFDAIICTQVLEHVRAPWRVPAEFFRVLKSGGHAVITVPQFNELHEEPNDYFRYTNHGISSLFEDQGFQVVHIRPRGGFYSVVAQACIRYVTDRCHMYERPIIGRIFGRMATLCARASLWCDRRDTSHAGQVNVLGWCIVIRKQ